MESNTEAEKGNASDARKRSGFAWGIGRELYTSPFIWVEAKDCNITEGKCFDTFEVRSITIENKKITALEIYNTKKKCVAYEFGKKANNAPKNPAPEVKQDAPDPFVCCTCGKVVDENMAMRTFGAFGVILCRECGIKRSAKK